MIRKHKSSVYPSSVFSPFSTHTNLRSLQLVLTDIILVYDANLCMIYWKNSTFKWNLDKPGDLVMVKIWFHHCLTFFSCNLVLFRVTKHQQISLRLKEN
jgi:hypothetical protein